MRNSKQEDSIVPVGKFLKDNKKHIPNLPNEFDTDAKVKKLRIAAFPLVLPIVQSYEFEEGEIEDKQANKNRCVAIASS